MALFFAVTLFVSAFLLFLVQPMVGKMVLPLLGGAPAAWATCMVFFQALLLAGYAYAHAATRRLGARRQAVIHLVVLALPLVVLGVTALATGAPVRAYRALAPQGQTLPFVGAIALLSAAIGLPFLVVSTSAPLLQRWFADTNHPAARDPYFLYAASNLGSLLALVAYPFLVEPRLPLAAQAWLWSAGYLLLVGLTAGCAWQLRRSPPPLTALVPEHVDPPPRWADRLRWLALAFVPSSLLLSVTQFITTDIAPVPGLWVLPLALYLVTFIVAFGRTPRLVRQVVEVLTPVAVLLLLWTLITDKKPESLGVVLAMHLVVFLLVALNLHTELARRRPAAGRLTEFYLWVSLGGVLGGLFNSLVAPLVFPDLYEYPLALIAACFLQPAGEAHDDSPPARALDFAAPLGVAGLVFALSRLPREWLPLVAKFPIPYYGPFQVLSTTLKAYLAYGVPALASYLWVDRPLRFGLCVAALWLVPTITTELDLKYGGRPVRRDRSFFGILSVQESEEQAEDRTTVPTPDAGRPREFNRLVHGTTLHGLQQTDPRSSEPLTYYHRTGPIGQVFAAAPPAVARGRFAFVGLGTGTLAAYGRPGQSITFYEIDPAVLRIAEDPRYFTYLHDCKAKYDVVLGDARLKLEEHAKPGEYGLIVVDAFSSDAIPVHLLTKEAVQLYLDKLADDGVIALHISNRYLDLQKVVGRLAAELRLAGLKQWDLNDLFVPKHDGGVDTAANRIPGKRASQWVVLTRDRKHLEPLLHLPPTMDVEGHAVPLSPWEELTNDDGPLWTDDFSNLTQILNWEQILPSGK
ncbi:MAG TPA: fused MFS/spermidine synthase [Gemmataceae bacterium]